MDADTARVVGLYERAEAQDGPGVIGIVCGEQGRWSDFTLAMTHLIKTRGTLPASTPAWTSPGNATPSSAPRSSATPAGWIIGDDHLFNGDVILRMLAHDVDVCVPNVLQRSAPFYPVIYQGIREEDGHHMLKFDLPPRAARGLRRR